MSETDVVVVLAHGAWADGTSWSKVIAAAPLAADHAGGRRGRPQGARAHHMPMITAAPVVVGMLLEAVREVEHSR